MQAPREVVIGREAARILAGKPGNLGLGHFALQSPENASDGAGYVIANGEYTFDLPIEAIGPNVAAGIRVDQLRCHAHVLIVALYAALDHITNVEVLTHLPDIGGFVLVSEGGIARHHLEVGKLGERGD